MNEGEFRNAQFQQSRMDSNSFFGMLIRAIYKADLVMKAFPDLTESVKRWQTEGGYAAKLILAFDDGKGKIDNKRIE